MLTLPAAGDAYGHHTVENLIRRLAVLPSPGFRRG